MDILDKRTLGRSIRQARCQSGLTQEEMAERLEMSPEEYGRMERGSLAPRLERFVAVCRVLGVPPGKLMPRVGEEPEEARNPFLPPEARLRLLRTTLSTNVRDARMRLGLTQAEMAERINMPVTLYGRMERGGLLPSLESFVAICRVLGDLSENLLDPPRSRKRP